MNVEENDLINLALSEGEIESTTDKTIVDKFIKDLNLQPGKKKISVQFIHDYFFALYNDETCWWELGFKLGKKLERKRSNYSIDELKLNVTIEDMKTKIVKAAYESRKKKNKKEDE